MRGLELRISPFALLAASLMYFFDEEGLYAAMLPAAAVHELGHFAALKSGGIRLRRLSFGAGGLEMDYWGSLSGLTGAAAIAAGPIFGLIYGLLVFSHLEYFRLSGWISLALSLFNLLPVLPLDGGRLLTMAMGRRGEIISRGMSVCAAVAGLWLLLSQGIFTPFALGVWLLWCNFRHT